MKQDVCIRTGDTRKDLCVTGGLQKDFRAIEKVHMGVYETEGIFKGFCGI